MQDHTINGVKFTKTEIKILACFASYISKSKLIGSILGSSPKTIDTHIDNIKRKINVHSKDDILFFVKKSKQVNLLKQLCNEQYITHKYLKTATIISNSLKPMDIICNINVSPELKEETNTNDIIKSIGLTGIKTNTIDDLQSLLDNSSNLVADSFLLFIVPSKNEIESLQKRENNLDNKVIYIYLEEMPNKISLPNSDNIILYNKDNKKSFYHFFIRHLIKHYPVINKLDQKFDFLSSIYNLEKDIDRKSVV